MFPCPFGDQISNLDELEDGLSYVCSCNNENFKKVEYNTTSQPLANLSNKANNRLSKHYRPSSPLKNGSSGVAAASGGGGFASSTVPTNRSDGMMTGNHNAFGVGATNAGNPSAGVGNTSLSGGGSIFNTSVGQNSGTNAASNGLSNGSPMFNKLQERDSVVHPRIVTLIRNGTKPRKVKILFV